MPKVWISGVAVLGRMRSYTAEFLEMTQELQRLAKDTPAWYAGTRTRVEARATLEQVEELGRVLEELGRTLGE